MDCDLCRTLVKMTENNPQAHFPIRPAIFAVRETLDEGEAILLVCAECMAEYYGMHDTVLLLADTYIPKEGGSEI